MKLRSLAFAIAVVCSPTLSASQLKLYPVSGLFVPESGSSLVNAAFSEAVPRADAGKYFRDEFHKAFPDAVASIADKDRRFTLVSSLQIARASYYTVDKVDGTIDLLVPVSGSLYFTNAVSGEVLYTVAATYYARATVSRGGADLTRVQSLFATAYHGLVAELLSKARVQFKPHAVAATVKREWNGLYILDHGQDAGIAKGDSLADSEGNTIDVLYSAPGYAVGTQSLGKITTGGTFSRETNADLAELKRPRVMVLVDQVPQEMPAEIVSQLFTDQLGAKAALSVVQVNPLFAGVLATAFASTSLSSDNSSKRELPDYFLRLSVPHSLSYELPTSARSRTVRSYRTIATAELVDRTGRVLFATSGSDRSDDEVIAGMALDEASRREISLKNALLDLAQHIGTELKFEHAELPLDKAAPLVLADRNGVLTAGDQVTLFRNIGRVDGISGDIRVPYTEVSADSPNAGGMQLADGLRLTSTAVPAAVGDVALIDVTGATHGATRRRFAACGHAEQLGAIALPAFDELALNTFARTYRAPFYSTAMFSRVQALVGPDSRFKSHLALVSVKPDYCVQPVYRIDSAPSQCGGEPRACQDTATVRITYRINQGATVVARSGLESRVSGAGYLERAQPGDRRNSLDSDLLDASSKLARDIAASLNNQKIN